MCGAEVEETYVDVVDIVGVVDVVVVVGVVEVVVVVGVVVEVVDVVGVVEVVEVLVVSAARQVEASTGEVFGTEYRSLILICKA